MPTVNRKNNSDMSPRECFGDISFFFVYLILNNHRHMHTYIYIMIYIYISLHRQNKERKAEGKRFNQMIAKWLNRSVRVGHFAFGK